MWQIPRSLYSYIHKYNIYRVRGASCLYNKPGEDEWRHYRVTKLIICDFHTSTTFGLADSIAERMVYTVVYYCMAAGIHVYAVLFA